VSKEKIGSYTPDTTPIYAKQQAQTTKRKIQFIINNGNMNSALDFFREFTDESKS
jgi:hypothetical protein